MKKVLPLSNVLGVVVGTSCGGPSPEPSTRSTVPSVGAARYFCCMAVARAS
jgi:hypothetical protein